LAAGCDIEPSMPRMPPSQCHRVNVPAATPQQYWYRALYLPLIDQLIQELNDRLLTHHDLFLGQYLMPTQLGALSGDTKNQIYNTYNNIFDNRILRWKARWKLAKGDKPSNLEDMLGCSNEVPHLNVVTLLTILIMPMSTVTPERSFSTMTRVKTYMSSTTLSSNSFSVFSIFFIPTRILYLSDSVWFYRQHVEAQRGYF